MLIILLTLGVVIVVAWFGIAWTAQRYVIWPGQFRSAAQAYPPHEKQNVEVLHMPIDAQDASQGQLEAWFMPGQGVSDAAPGPVVFFAHGNGEFINDWIGDMNRYRNLGVSVFMPEYRGYGNSNGSPSIKTITSDMIRWYDQLVQRPDVDASRIVFHGRSIGGGVIGELSRYRKPDAVVLESTFTSINRMARRFLVPSFLVHQSMDVNGTVSALDVPVLVVHGDSDSLIPLQHAKDNDAAMAKSTLHIYPGLNHNSPMPSWFQKDLEDWLIRSDILEAKPAQSEVTLEP